MTNQLQVFNADEVAGELELLESEMDKCKFNKAQVFKIWKDVADNQRSNPPSKGDMINFISTCRMTDANPMVGEAYLVPFGGSYQMVYSYKYFIRIARKSGLYKGHTQEEYADAQGNWSTFWNSRDMPIACRVGIRIAGDPEPTFATVYSKDFTIQGYWKKNPLLMLKKCAVVSGLRMTIGEFPNQYEEGELGSITMQAEVLSVTDRKEAMKRKEGMITHQQTGWILRKLKDKALNFANKYLEKEGLDKIESLHDMTEAQAMYFIDKVKDKLEEKRKAIPATSDKLATEVATEPEINLDPDIELEDEFL